jgi:hypothetical protein
MIEADRIILDAELDLLTLPPLLPYEPLPVASMRTVRRDVNRLSREIQREIDSNRRFLLACVFALSLIAGVLLLA